MATFLVIMMLAATVADGVPAKAETVVEKGGESGEPTSTEPSKSEADDSSDDLDFDLLGDAPDVAPVDPDEVTLRRVLLTTHQSFGIGLVAATTALCVIGQLSYFEQFGGDQTGKYQLPHAVLGYTTLGLFAATASLSLLAPEPYAVDDQGVDRTLIHEISLVVAGVAMAAGTVLGIYTADRTGYQNQETLAQAHLASGYTALAAMLVGVGALIF
jgi:hypothetical protein